MDCIAKKESTPYQGNDKLLFGMVLAVITFWLFSQTTLNIAPAMRSELQIDETWSNIAISISSLFAGIFIVVMGGLGDKLGRVKFLIIGIVLNMVGSFLIAASPTGTPVFLLVGRAIQGLSAACIIPATLAMLRTYYEGAARQRAISFWSIGTWGSSGLCSLFGGAIASTIGWRWIFWFSIVVSIISYLFIRNTPESIMDKKSSDEPFDWGGLTSFIVFLLSLNLVIGQGAKLGWSNPIIIILFSIFVVAFAIFYKIEMGKPYAFVDFKLFKNKTYAGVTLSNLFLNACAGTILVVLNLMQKGAGMSSFKAGTLTLGYLIAVLSTIRVGEKLLQKFGARRPMIWGCCITGFGIFLMTFTFIYTWQYVILGSIGFTIFGIGLGFYATPSTDAALSNIPQNQAGTAAGIFKMSSFLGVSFGVAISAALLTGLSASTDFTYLNGLFWGRTDNIPVRLAALVALYFNLLMTILSTLAIVITVPKK